MPTLYEDFDSKYSKDAGPVGTATAEPAQKEEPLPKSRAMAADKVPVSASPEEVPAYEQFDQQNPAQAAAPVTPLSVEPTGMDPMSSIPDSPLSILDRARLGWVRTPQAQKKILADRFGEENVQLVQQDGAQSGFVVKDKDNKWYQVDPHLSWKNLGPLSYPEISGENLKKMADDAPGDLSQFAGEYGLRTVGAAGAVAAGAPLIAASGPYAPATAIGLAGMGSAGGEAVNKGLQHFTNPELDASSAEELSKQLQAAFLFGMEQEAGGQFFKLGGQAAIGGLTKTLKAVSDTPQGRYLASKALSLISGQPESLMRVRVDDPSGVAKFDSVAMSDAVNATNKLGDMMKTKIQGLYDDFQKRKSLVFGKQYDAIEEHASTLNFDPMKSHGADAAGSAIDPTTQLMQELKDGGYIKNGKPVSYQSSRDVERMLTNNEQKTLSYMLAQTRNVAEKTLQNKPVSFQEMKNVIGTLDRVLYEQDGIGDANLRRVLQDYRRNLKNNVIDTIAEKNPDLAKKYVELDQKYAPAKKLLENLASKTEDQKVDSFMQQVMKQDGTFNSDLIGNLSDLLGTKDPTSDILKMHVAKNSTDFLHGRRFMKVIPGSPYLASRAVTGVSKLKEPVKPIVNSTIAYTDKVWQFLKNLPASQRMSLMSQPEALDVIGKITASASHAEQEDAQRMLQEGGVMP